MPFTENVLGEPWPYGCWRSLNQRLAGTKQWTHIWLQKHCNKLNFLRSLFVSRAILIYKKEGLWKLRWIHARLPRWRPMRL